MAPHRSSHLLAPALLATALLGTGPAAAGADETPAGSVSVSRACYVNTAAALAQITVSGRGWEAGATIELTDRLNRVSATATAGADGAFSAQVPAPEVEPGTALEISDAIRGAYENAPGLPGATGASASSTAFLTTNYEVRRTPDRTTATARSIFQLSGFTPGRTVYAHYLSAAGRPLTSVSFGRPTGPCGLRRVAGDAYPGGHAVPGRYTVQFDNSPAYRERTQPAYRLALQIRRP